MIFGGIDPGLDGAIAFIDADGTALKVFRVPYLTITRNRKEKNEAGERKKSHKRDYLLVDMRQIFVAALLLADDKGFHVGLENVHAMPKQGVTSMWSMGRGMGIWEGLLVGLGVSYEKITPQRWKKTLMDGAPKDKGSSILVAKRLFPSVEFTRKKDHGMADALLIAEHTRRTWKSQVIPNIDFTSLD